MEIIGEKINTTRKTVERAVREKDKAFIQDLAGRQADSGATYLDVNSGTALYPEEEAEDLAWLVQVIQEAVELPLCIDSAHPSAIEKALCIHRGRAMINSINGDPKTMDALFPLIKKYQCKVVAMTSSREAGIPSGSMERLKIAQAIAGEAEKYGVPLEDVYFDPLVLSISTDHRNGLLFLETLKEIRKEIPKARTISGLSNISYGLPKRRLINQTFLVMCLYCGMDAAILDPTDKETMALIQAGAVLIGKDAFCSGYLRAFRSGILDF
ncbi:MAG: methyltetrahydrofolate cobalamin methyltransferase [Desulfobacteraceae bacterium]|nr:MAG: methyltetrahydrofolate cobalamin methyltransferase [Desulfobacteraceae bacterium]